MTQLKSDNQEPVIFPPRIEASKLSNKYEDVFDFKWGTYERQIKVSKELGSWTFNFTKAMNVAFIEGSESKPYDI